jgi:hypothetical protein
MRLKCRLLCATRKLNRCQSGIQAEIVLLLNVIKHPITARCYNAHGSDLNLYFQEVFIPQMWKGKFGKP